MGTSIKIDDLGLSVFGQAQVGYTVNGISGRSFDEAIAAAGFSRTVAIEDALPAYSAALQRRQTKLRELGEALADIARANASFGRKDKLDATQSVDSRTRDILKRYGISGVGDDCKVKKENVQKVQADAQYAIDIEDNNVQQDLTTMQGLMNKRDNAYGLVSKIVKKAIGTEASNIRYLG